MSAASTRPASVADAEAIARIHAEGIAEGVATFETRPPDADDVASLIAGGAPILVVEREGTVVGFAKIGPYSDPSPYYAGVGEATLYVSAGARGAGLGRG